MRTLRTGFSPWLILPILLIGMAIGYFVFRSLDRPERIQGEQVPKTYHFLYYPAANMYYDLEAAHYSYPNAAGEWQTSPSFPAVLKRDTAHKVALTSPIPQIWMQNESHRMRYAAQVYAQPEDFKTPPPPPPPAVKLPDSTEAQPKKENKVKKFFKKLFAKRDGGT